MSVQRIDPTDCGCTDCLTGYSTPVNLASDSEIRRMIAGEVMNATGRRVFRTVTYRLDWDKNYPGVDRIELKDKPVDITKF